jgi:uncharacterized protein (DUF2236 family)
VRADRMHENVSTMLESEDTTGALDPSADLWSAETFIDRALTRYRT